MKKPIIGFVGMTHLGLVSGVSASEKGFDVLCFDRDAKKVKLLNELKFPVSEPQLIEIASKNRNKIHFTSSLIDLMSCDVVYVAPDIPTDDHGKSDLTYVDDLLGEVYTATKKTAVIVLLSQVPPGFSRQRVRVDRCLYYQVETLIFGRAVERALHPERYIIGSSDPSTALNEIYKNFLEAYDCPILVMKYESAELAKISINMCLVASVSTANTLAEICEKIGADWSEIIPALKLDKRIGEFSYIVPGLGIAGGNLERDLATVCNLADEFDTDAGVVKAWILNSQHRRNWPLGILETEILRNGVNPTIAIWGLAYKQDTHSVKNSAAIQLISKLQKYKLTVYDPVVPWSFEWHSNCVVADNALEAISDADVLVLMTPWEEFKGINFNLILANKKLKTIIDPYCLLNGIHLQDNRIRYFTLGK